MLKLSIASKLALDYQDDGHMTRLKHLFDLESEGIFHLDNSGTVTFYNPHFYHQFGIKSASLPLDVWRQLAHPDDRGTLISRIDQAHLLPDQKVKAQYRLKRASGDYVWIEVNAICKYENGTSYIVGNHRDISEKKLFESVLQKAAFFDPHSELYNLRKLLTDIDQLKAERTTFSIVSIQIDNLQTHANELGTSNLDYVVEQIKEATSVFQHHKTEIYHVSLDHYAVLVQDINNTASLLSLCSSFKIRYQDLMADQGNLFADTISIGIYPMCNPELPGQEMINIAHRTGSFAYGKTASHIEMYQGETQQQVDRYFFIESGLKDALINKDLTVKFHPIIDAKANEVASFEALVRWHSKEYGEIYPDEFISVAEQKGLIVELGYQVFERACKFLSTYNTIHETQVRVNVNVSVLQILNREVPHQFRQIAEQYELEPNSIVIELTETIMLDNNKHALQQLSVLRDMGFSLSLDDFGAGFSSINSFFDFPFNQIKIDKLFAHKTLRNEASNNYLQFLIEMCRENHMGVVIEGVEDSEMAKKFAAMGASHLQGYWFAKPLSVATASRYSPKNLI